MCVCLYGAPDWAEDGRRLAEESDKTKNQMVRIVFRPLLYLGDQSITSADVSVTHLSTYIIVYLGPFFSWFHELDDETIKSLYQASSHNGTVPQKEPLR